MIIISPGRTKEQLAPLINQAYMDLQSISPQNLKPELENAIHETIGMMSRGHFRVATPTEKGWETQAWLKEAILAYFKIQGLEKIHSEPFQWIDKIPIKKFEIDMGVRSVPLSTVRFGSYVAKSCVLMPSYVNIGAYIDEGTMVDTWATVGSCAQIGKNVHLSGGVGIGGVLEPAQAQPVIIEDDCFIGSRAIVVEGVLVQKGSVLGAGVVLTMSTPILDVTGKSPVMTKGVVPPQSVVIPGTIPKKFPAGEYGVPCALIIGKRKESTDRKTSLNQVLREFQVPV